MSAPPPDPDTWFEAELRPHEPMLRAWLASRFPHLTEIDDILQEAYALVLAARRRGTAMRSPKAFLFATARHRAIDFVRARAARPAESLAEIDSLHVLDDADGIPESIARHQELELLTQAIQSLPDRCRQVLTLRRLYGLPQKEIAARLGITEHTVEAQVTIGVRKCTEFLARYWEK
ncbi:MAG: sigma-70 family RNA polymerase sigma factor [Verrucomicrobia bacterium]|nr:sigma-70 family RNA polymerase sigma factor [Verrucomicrobiota bacterium]